MSKTPNEQLLFELIHSLSKSEKRGFKLFVKRSGATSDSKFIRLFDQMEKMASYDEEVIKKRLSDMSASQFSNLKSHLYGQILASLRISNLKHDIDIELREQLDYIRLLYKKGLYHQSLRLLNRAKNTTGNYRKDLFQLSLLDYEKQIRSQQVFDLEEDYVKALDEQTDQAMLRFSNVQKFFTLAIKMKARFIEKGMVKSERELNNLRALFYTNLPDHKESELAFNEKFYLYRASYWFSYLSHDFASCVKYAEKWVNIFKETGLDKKRRAGFLKGLNRLLQSAFRIDDFNKFQTYYEELTHFEKEEGPTLASNTHALLVKYKAMQTLNKVFLEGSFEASQTQIEENIDRVEQHRSFIDQHNLTVIYYKAGVYYFALEDYDKSRLYLNKLIHDRDHLRGDLKGFARIIDILVDYNLGEEEDMEQKIKSALIYIKKEDGLGEFQTSFLNFIAELGDIFPQDLKASLVSLRKNLVGIQKNPLASKPLLYFDFISWVDAQIEGKSFADIVIEKVSQS
ncbi:hypothetical protein [Roseivirga sp. E12]|uniref:hypothetical protein n=1 Tax=Roseivirga sp. E12 TaxID=2819237 RepID=UPI001ABC0B44|nr:hypothetical protein [Roseivirga sp. E12]MBO3697419.1 hypothetical protein [Roseivirga sp. E12]